MKRFGIVLTALVLAMLALPAFSEDWDERGGRDRDDREYRGDHGGKRGHGKKQGMQLTDQQKDKLKAINTERKDAMKASKERVNELHSKLKEALKAEKMDTGAVKTILAGIKSERAKLHKTMESIQSKLESALNPIQLAKMELARGKMGHGGGKGQGKGQGQWKERGRGGDDEGGWKERRGRGRGGDEGYGDEDRRDRRRGKHRSEEDEE